MTQNSRKPWLPGDNLGSVQAVAQGNIIGGNWGFGCPGGAPTPTRAQRITPRNWAMNRLPFDRPCMIVPVGAQDGVLYVFECQTATGYNQAGVNLWTARRFRPGQVCFINRPGQWSFYYDSDNNLDCHIYDFGSINIHDPHTQYLTGYDATLPGWRGIGATAADPAALLVSDAASAASFATIIAAIAALATQLGSAAAFVTDTATVAVPGTAQQCPSHVPANGRSILVVALSTNTDYIWIGESALQAQARLIPLAAGQSLELTVNNSDLIWIDAAVGGEGVGLIVET
jgi:hypothetical protein